MNKRHEGHAAAVCNEGSYDMGGYNGASASLDCVERRNVKDLLHFSTTTKKQLEEEPLEYIDL